MASINDLPAMPSLRAGFSRLTQGVSSVLSASMHARSRSEEINALQALSDDELAARGLTRDRIVLHVFRDQIAF